MSKCKKITSVNTAIFDSHNGHQSGQKLVYLLFCGLLLVSFSYVSHSDEACWISKDRNWWGVNVFFLTQNNQVYSTRNKTLRESWISFIFFGCKNNLEIVPAHDGRFRRGWAYCEFASRWMIEMCIRMISLLNDVGWNDSKMSKIKIKWQRRAYSNYSEGRIFW